jgi:hypothetical protein
MCPFPHLNAMTPEIWLDSPSNFTSDFRSIAWIWSAPQTGQVVGVFTVTSYRFELRAFLLQDEVEFVVVHELAPWSTELSMRKHRGDYAQRSSQSMGKWSRDENGRKTPGCGTPCDTTR